jgi:iron complex outermembrane recepter protein
VTGEGVRLGRVGRLPIGQPARNLQANLDWRPPWIEGLSLEANVAHLSRRAARLDNQLFLPDRTLVDVGARYRFKLAGGDATLRVRTTNLFNVYDFDLRGAGAFDLIPGRVGFISLAADF